MNARLVKTMCSMSALFMATFVTVISPQPTAADDYDPPGRVARLNYLRGSVSFQPAGESDWVSAVVNRPVTTGDMLWTDDGSRAEMHLGSATVRLDARTGMSFLNLDDRATQIQLSEGTLNIRVLRLDRDENFEVDTPNQAFSILQPGQYRIQASEDGSSTMVTVRAGAGEVTGGGRTYSVGAGLSGNFTGTDSLYADIFRAGGTDEFDGWSQDRDRREEKSQSARYVSRDVVGYEDLDDNGSWRSDPDYGNVWVPRVAAGWAPYRDGHWAWISPWGWTWVDDAPWGYAPFHYGRWVYARNNWGWVPGPIAVRPVYAPALVAFVGGPSFGLSVSFGGGRGGGNVGWFPLGPREVYVPSYNSSRDYVTRVNVSNTNVNNTTIINVYNNQTANNGRGNNQNNANIRYANRAAPGGVTVVSQNTFTSAQPVGRAVVSVNPRDIASAPVSRRAEVAPTRNSVFGTSAPTGNRVARPPAEISSRSVVAKTPPPPPPVPFERQQQRLAAEPGQPLARNEVDGLRPANVPAAQPRVRQAPPGRPAAADSNQPGRQFGNGQPPNAPPANVGANPPVNNPPANIPPANNAPPGRGNQPDRSNRGFGNGQPANQPPANAAPNPPVNNPPANIPPANNAPPGRGNQPDRSNRGFGNGQPANQPPANAAPNPPVNNPPANNPPANNAPPVRGNQPDRSNRGFGNGQPANQPPANAAPNPPVNNPPANNPPANIPPANNAPPVRGNQPDRSNRGRNDNGQPPSPPPANVAPNPPASNPPPNSAPANNAPPVRGNQPDRSNRGQPGNAPPPSPPPASAAPNPPANNPPPNSAPANNAPPSRNDRPNGANRGQPPDKAPPANETPEEKKAREKGQPPPR